MRDSNYAIRALAVDLAGHFRDRKLIEEIKHLFKNEKVWAVRQKILEAIGKMKIVTLRPDLEALIASNESLPGEKALAIAALLELLDTINRCEIEKLSSSNRSGLRQLACQVIVHFQSSRDIDQLLLLVSDSHSVVRLEAFQALGQLRPDKKAIFEAACVGIKDANYQVALSAAWLLTLYAPQEGQQAFIRHLNDRRSEVRAFAAAALGATGHYGLALILDNFQKHPDPYVRLNLALSLIGLRESTQDAANLVMQMLIVEKEKWCTIEAGFFEAIVNKQPKIINDSSITPEVDNQLLRLELLNLLAILKAPGTQEAIREYLMERSWEISATAVVLLLTEGDESSIEIVKHLL